MEKETKGYQQRWAANQLATLRNERIITHFLSLSGSDMETW